MRQKIFPDNCIVLDGRMDEPVWDEVPEVTGFTRMLINGGGLVEDQTFVRIIPCQNYVYFGIKCVDPDMAFAKSYVSKNIYQGNSVEVFLSPSNNVFQVYNFALTLDGLQQTVCYIEGGIQEIYNPQWDYAIHMDDDYWSVEIQFPLTAFYHTSNEVWSDVWLCNVLRNQPTPRKHYSGATVYENSSWAQVDKTHLAPDSFETLTGMPIRPLRNDMRFIGVSLDLDEHTADGYRGLMTVSVTTAVSDTYTFASDFSEPATVTLDAGTNNFTVPCRVAELKRHKIAVEFKRETDGEVFRFYFPVTATFEPIRIEFSQPEYRTNFYPGQDSSKIVGRVVSRKAVTLKLEGGAMATQVITPDKDGNFTFETPDFQQGREAVLTAATDGWEIKKTMRNLAPNGHTMSWISGGRLMVDGKPVLRRNMYATYYNGGEAFRRKYEADDLHETRFVTWRTTQPFTLVPGSQTSNAAYQGEACFDRMPSEQMLKRIDEVLAFYKNQDYVYNHTWDEPEYYNTSLIYMKNIYEYLCEKDPYHVVENSTHNPDWYMPYCDWLETHPYLGAQNTKENGRIYTTPVNKLPGYLDPAVQLNQPDKCLGFITTCFAYKYITPEHDYPTFEEILSHTWVMFNHGAKTVSSFAYYDLNDRPRLYEGTRYLFASLEALEKPILFGNRKPILHNEFVDAALYEYGDDTFFALVNMSAMPQIVTLDGVSGAWYHFRHNRTFTNNTFTLKPFEVLIGTRAMKDKNLPTYQQTAALIGRLEAERENNKSLLFGREADLEVTASTAWKMYKLFDGVKDNLACEMRGKDLFVEVDLTKVKPKFSKVVLSGWHLEGAQIKARSAGEWIELEPANIENEEFSVTFTLNEAICPDAIRFEFPQERIELYELEVFA